MNNLPANHLARFVVQDNMDYIKRLFVTGSTSASYIPDLFQKDWVTINGHHVLIGDDGNSTESHSPESHKGGTAADNEISQLHETAVAQNESFQSSVDKVGKDLNAKVEHGPVKNQARMREKLNEYDITSTKSLLDTNRATLIVDDPSKLNEVVDATKKEFGDDNVVRVKDKFAVEGYRSAIINVVGDKGVTGEVAVTTPEMWAAKMTLGGDQLYHAVRSGQDETGAFYVRMTNLYSNAQMAVNARLGKSL